MYGILVWTFLQVCRSFLYFRFGWAGINVILHGRNIALRRFVTNNISDSCACFFFCFSISICILLSIAELMHFSCAQSDNNCYNPTVALNWFPDWTKGWSWTTDYWTHLAFFKNMLRSRLIVSLEIATNEWLNSIPNYIFVHSFNGFQKRSHRNEIGKLFAKWRYKLFNTFWSFAVQENIVRFDFMSFDCNFILLSYWWPVSFCSYGYVCVCANVHVIENLNFVRYIKINVCLLLSDWSASNFLGIR